MAIANETLSAFFPYSSGRRLAMGPSPQVWNHRPLRADEPDNKVWVRERSTLEGMGPGPVGPLAKIGKRMFAGGADGRIRVYM